jgi:hypothetical protein
MLLQDAAEMTNVHAANIYASNKRNLTPLVLWMIILAQIDITAQIILQIYCNLISKISKFLLKINTHTGIFHFLIPSYH